MTTGMINSCIHSQPVFSPNSVYCQSLPQRVFRRCSSSSWSSCLGCCCVLFSTRHLRIFVPLWYRSQTTKPLERAPTPRRSILCCCFYGQGRRYLVRVLARLSFPGSFTPTCL